MRNLFKKGLSAAIALSMTASMAVMIPITASAEAAAIGSSNTKWEYDGRSKTLTISGEGEMPDLGMDKFPWNSNMKNIETIVIESGVTAIAAQAFRSTTATSVTIPDGITKIGQAAFYSSAINSLSIPNSVGEIVKNAFARCGSLKSVTISDTSSNPATSMTIGESTFACCDILESVTLPESLTSLGDRVFGDCPKLKNVSLPKTAKIEAIPGVAFVRCRELASITIPDTVKSIGQNAFLLNKITRVDLPNGLLTLEHHAFSGCPLESVTIPETVTFIGRGAFAAEGGVDDAGNIYEPATYTSVYIPASVQTIETGAFICTALKTIAVADNNNGRYSVENGCLVKTTTVRERKR